MLLFLFITAAGGFWFAAQGVASGETRLPTKNNHARHTISRTEKPAMFWTSISIFATLGTGCTGVAAWLVISRLMIKPAGRGNPDR